MSPPRNFHPDEKELMDRPQPVSEELEKDLENLISLNRYFGSHSLVRHFLRKWFEPGGSYRVLDVCTGAGDIPRVMADWARAHNVTLHVEAVDSQPSTLSIARKWSSDYPEIHFVENDILSYDTTIPFDLVHCSLALHHFSEADATRVLKRCRDLSNRWVLIADLERAWHTTLGVQMLTTFCYRDEMTKHDARVSAERAFSFSELKTLAKQAGWKAPGHARFVFCRQAIWLDEQRLGDVPIESEPIVTSMLPGVAN